MPQPYIHVLTHREGLLSAVGHDLRLHFDRFEVALDSGVVTATVHIDSLRVDGAIKRGHVTDPLSAKDRDSIEGDARRLVLRVDEHPTAQLRATVTPRGSGFAAQGELTLCGVTRPWAARAERDGGAVVCSWELVPSQFGIQPFRAMAGTLKVADRVEIVVGLPLDPQLGDPRAESLHFRLPQG